MYDANLGEFGSGRIKRVIIGKIEPGHDLVLALTEIAKRERVRSGVILSVVGSLQKAVLRNVKHFPEHLPVTDADRLYKTVDGPLEILSVSGNIAQRDSDVSIHGHISVSTIVDSNIIVMGGHLTEGCVTWVNVEVAIAELEGVEVKRMLHHERRTPELHIS